MDGGQRPSAFGSQSAVDGGVIDIPGALSALRSRRFGGRSALLSSTKQ